MHVSQVWCDGNFFLDSALFNGTKHNLTYECLLCSNSIPHCHPIPLLYYGSSSEAPRSVQLPWMAPIPSSCRPPCPSEIHLMQLPFSRWGTLFPATVCFSVSLIGSPRLIIGAPPPPLPFAHRWADWNKGGCDQMNSVSRIPVCIGVDLRTLI
jgi:hypothetical protein